SSIKVKPRAGAVRIRRVMLRCLYLHAAKKSPFFARNRPFVIVSWYAVQYHRRRGERRGPGRLGESPARNRLEPSPRQRRVLMFPPRAPRRRSKQTPTGRARLRLEPLEDRTLLSTSIPLNRFTWTPMGPAPITDTNGSIQQTHSGRITGIAVDPTDPSVYYVAAAGGGVWK